MPQISSYIDRDMDKEICRYVYKLLRGKGAFGW